MNPDVDEAIRIFYEQKELYESERKSEAERIATKGKSPQFIRWSKVQRQEMAHTFAHLPTPNCINCSRPVGTLFDRKRQTRDGTKPFVTYLVRCGDLADPCPLHIEIIQNIYRPYRQVKQECIETVNELKRLVIESQCMWQFFGIELTEEEGQEFIQQYGFLNEKIGSITERFLHTSNVIPLLEELENDCIRPFQELVRSNQIGEANQLYANKMTPLLQQIREAKFSISQMQTINPNTRYALLQQIEPLDPTVSLNEDVSRVVRFVFPTLTKEVKQGRIRRRQVRDAVDDDAADEEKDADVVVVEETKTRRPNKRTKIRQTQDNDSPFHLEDEEDVE